MHRRGTFVLQQGNLSTLLLSTQVYKWGLGRMWQMIVFEFASAIIIGCYTRQGMLPGEWKLCTVSAALKCIQWPGNNMLFLRALCASREKFVYKFAIIIIIITNIFKHMIREPQVVQYNEKLRKVSSLPRSAYAPRIFIMVRINWKSVISTMGEWLRRLAIQYRYASQILNEVFHLNTDKRTNTYQILCTKTDIILKY